MYGTTYIVPDLLVLLYFPDVYYFTYYNSWTAEPCNACYNDLIFNWSFKYKKNKSNKPLFWHILLFIAVFQHMLRILGIPPGTRTPLVRGFWAFLHVPRRPRTRGGWLYWQFTHEYSFCSILEYYSQTSLLRGSRG